MVARFSQLVFAGKCQHTVAQTGYRIMVVRKAGGLVAGVRFALPRQKLLRRRGLLEAGLAGVGADALHAGQNLAAIDGRTLQIRFEIALAGHVIMAAEELPGITARFGFMTNVAESRH